MTIDEGIKNLEYGTKQLEMELESGLWIKGSESELSCKEGIALNKQYIEWLRELKEAKRLLKAAVEDLDFESQCRNCKHKEHGLNTVCKECRGNRYEWRYADEALKLIGDSEN